MKFWRIWKMVKLFTRMEWDLLEYNVNKEIDKVSCDSQKFEDNIKVFKKPSQMDKEAYICERKAGNYIERRSIRINNGGNHIIRLPDVHLWEGEKPLKVYHRISDCSIDTETGEFLTPDVPRVMRTNDSRFSNPRSVLRSCNNFKWLIRANADKIRLFVTLTYAKNMTDTKQLYEDYRSFWQRLQYAYPCLTGYLVAFEPQKRGAWHAHMLLLSDKRGLFIPNKKMRAIWRKGFTKTQSCQNIHDIGSYLTSYLTNLKEGVRTKKGKRLYMYPLGFRFLRCSKGVERAKISRWYGDISRVDFNPLEYNLIYDYFNSFRLKDGRYQCRLITCLEKIPISSQLPSKD